MILIEKPVDLFYLTGYSLSKGALLLEEGKKRLVVDGRYRAMVEKDPRFEVLQAKDEWLRELEGEVIFDSAWTSVERFSELQSLAPKVRWIGVPSPLKKERLLKKPSEIESLRKAARLTREGIFHVKTVLSEGISEKEIAWQFEVFCRQRGASSLSFEPIVAFGENSAYPHHRAGDAVLKKNQVVLIDAGALCDHYYGDMTRVFFFGTPPLELQRRLAILRATQKEAIRKVRPGIFLGELDAFVNQALEQEGLSHLQAHSLGHGVGLEIHEFPRIKQGGSDEKLVLEPGMVFTIEPGIYEPGVGGLRVEDMVLVTSQGHEVLSGHAEF